MHTLKLKTQRSRDAEVKYEMLPAGHMLKNSLLLAALSWKILEGREGEKSLGGHSFKKKKSTCNFYSAS